MPWFADASRLIAAREKARAASIRAAQEITGRRENLLAEANQHRGAIDLDRCAVTAAIGITREGLFGRLRSAATAQAHSIEVGLHVAALETAASELVPEIAGHRDAARLNNLKAMRLKRWRDEAKKSEARLAERILERDTQEERTWSIPSLG
jgi:uncharacterized protein YbjT (DUF2867 family)